MRVKHLQIVNFRSFERFELAIDGASVTLVAPNASGKTSLLTGLGWALSGPRGVTRRDFRSITDPFEVRVTLTELDGADQSTFVDSVDFGVGGPTLVVGVRGIWDSDSDQLDLTWGYPERDWTRIGRDARERLSLVWLPADRDPSRLVAFFGARSLLAELLDSLPLDQPLDDAVAEIDQALHRLLADQSVAQLLGSLDAGLGGLIPDVIAGAFDVDAAATTPRDLLRQFELTLSHFGPHMPLEVQSSGLAQLTTLLIALRLASAEQSIVLVDEPETSLHPQAQRAMASAIRRTAHQSIVATHSSSVLSGVDARHVVRLKRGMNDIEAKRPSGLTQQDAEKLARYATPDTAEAFFARTVVFVEGPSDYLALRVVANILNIDLDAKGVAVISLQGAGLLATYLRLLGPQGLDLDLVGLCDVDAEQDWQTKLTAAGVPVADRAALNAAGFFVCDVDLESELVAALGDTAVQAAIAAEGDANRFASFANQPANRGLTLTAQLEAFARSGKVRWSPRLAADLTPTSVPIPIREVLARV
jgi:hypothetical protein